MIELLDAESAPTKGTHAVVLGRSQLVGRPMAQFLLLRDATVTIATPPRRHTADLAVVTRRANALVVTIGIRGLIGPERVQPGATVIDIGIHRTSTGLTGDVRPPRNSTAVSPLYRAESAP
ncbi:hypothetical protein ACIQVO_09240 [Streptomyces sp. NPDC101062]|uniref:hypothetical protein n=1 Tax=unclassified Streptomyces TaxID=2593676 RepID=UPI003830A66A